MRGGSKSSESDQENERKFGTYKFIFIFLHELYLPMVEMLKYKTRFLRIKHQPHSESNKDDPNPIGTRLFK